MGKTEEIMGWAKETAVVSSAKMQNALDDIKETLKLDLGNILLITYRRYPLDGWSEDEAKRMTLKLAKSQLERKIEETKAPI